MATPVAYAVARRNPDVEFTFATKAAFGKIFINPPRNLHILPVDLADYTGPMGPLRLYRTLAATQPDTVVDLHNVGRTWMVDSIFRIKGKRVFMVDKMRASRAQVLAGIGEHPSMISRFVDTFRMAGLDVDELKPVGKDLKAAPIHTSKPKVGIAPFARYTNKTYPPAMMKQVCNMLADEGCVVYLFGGRGAEASLLETWERPDGSIVSLAGKYSMARELEYMAAMDIMVSMDSANQHLASWAGTRVLTIWGSTSPACGFRPLNQQEDDSLEHLMPCHPCTIAGSEKCKNGKMECLTKLAPEYIVSEILNRIEK